MKKKHHKTKLPDLYLGPLPVDQINQALDLELDPGELIFSGGAQKHAFSRHPSDYPIYFPHVAAVAMAPLYVGDDHKNKGKIELVSRVLGQSRGLLVAVCIEPDEFGNYAVTSFYPINEKTIENRRQSKHLVPFPKK